MKAEQIKEPRWEDIVFDSRNKAYGAYFIRKEYSKHVLLGAVITVISVALLFAAPYVAKWIKGQQKVEVVETKSIKYTELAPPPP
ncbi:MAG: energy transducer TonB, partial [Marivirga sp.]|nr:energy transducer TonB [Marivirga sp.]